MRIGTRVEHPEYGRGVVKQVVGGQAIVEFYGEPLHVASDELTSLEDHDPPPVQGHGHTAIGGLMFRRAMEAINLGVVPPHPDQLLTLSIDGSHRNKMLEGWLRNAKTHGFCKAFFGDYGSGKSHHLKTLEALALKHGWAVSYVEFDPKEADPAKPHLVYRAIVSGLRFPPRDDGSRIVGFDGFIKEVRDHWPAVNHGRYIRKSPWFWQTLSLLRHFPHSDDQDYCNTCAFLAGQPNPLADVKRLAARTGQHPAMPEKMPRTKETGDIYVFHLVVLNEICQSLGFKGLLIILDEAEHVRGFNTKRRERANNLFELLSRCAHPPVSDDPPPIQNDHGIQLPKYWREGPHFGVAVGLTEGDTFANEGVPLREACAFLHTKEDAEFLKPTQPDHYKEWLEEFFELVYRHCQGAELLADAGNRRLLARTLVTEFKRLPERERVVRLWVKLACLVPSIVMSQGASDIEDLRSLTARAAREVAGNALPWEQ